MGTGVSLPRGCAANKPNVTFQKRFMRKHRHQKKISKSGIGLFLPAFFAYNLTFLTNN